MALTNEDLLAISQLLDTKLDSRLNPIKSDIKAIRDEQTLIKDEQRRMKDEQRRFRDEQTRIRLIIENDVLHAINILSENYVPAAKRYEKAADQIEAMQSDIDIMKKVLADHSEKLKKIS